MGVAGNGRRETKLRRFNAEDAEFAEEEVG
jgi:hypothetical protein